MFRLPLIIPVIGGNPRCPRARADGPNLSPMAEEARGANYYQSERTKGCTLTAWGLGAFGRVTAVVVMDAPRCDGASAESRSRSSPSPPPGPPPRCRTLFKDGCRNSHFASSLARGELTMRS